MHEFLFLIDMCMCTCRNVYVYVCVRVCVYVLAKDSEYNISSFSLKIVEKWMS